MCSRSSALFEIPLWSLGNCSSAKQMGQVASRSLKLENTSTRDTGPESEYTRDVPSASRPFPTPLTPVMNRHLQGLSSILTLASQHCSLKYFLSPRSLSHWSTSE